MDMYTCTHTYTRTYTQTCTHTHTSLYIRLQWGDQIIIIEMLDSVLDIITCSLTWLTGGFDYDNDPHYLLLKSVILVAVTTMILFASEVLFFEMKMRGSSTLLAQYFLVIHILCEDGLQLILYIFASASATQSSSQVALGLGILQGIIFFLFKTRELFNVRGYNELQA